MNRIVRSVIPILTAVVALGGAAAPAGAQDAPPKLSPYPAVRFVSADKPEVLMGERWYALEAIDGRTTAEILDYCRRTYDDRWQKRFTEDLVEVLWGLGKPRDERAVALTLIDAETGERIELVDVPMTRENRVAIMRAGDAHQPRQRVEREHAPGVPEAHRALVRRFFDEDAGPRLTAAQAAQDLDELEWRLVNEHSYTALGLRVSADDLRAALDAVRAGLGEGVALADFALQVQKVIAMTGDGHGGVRDIRDFWPAGYLPFLVEETADGLIAFREDRAGFVDEDRPVLVAIDGVPVERWLEAASRTVARGSPQLVRRRSVETLREIAYLRRELGLPESRAVEVEFGPIGGGATSRLAVPLAQVRPVYGEWPRADAKRTLDGIAYIRIADMSRDDDFIEEVKAAVREAAGQKGLIIDVRDNGGGSRDLLLELAPMFMDPADPPVVVNAAVYLRPPRAGVPAPRDATPLADRSLYPETWSGWSAAARQAIGRFASMFAPEVAPAGGAFSEWQYLVLAPDPDPAAVRFSGPVAVLMDAGCFSATDIFLAGLGGLPRVTLVGTPSSGGSGRAESERLEHSGLSVRLSTMVSYQPSGALFEGRGVQPDVLVPPRAGYMVGREDAVLDAAVAVIEPAAQANPAAEDREGR